MKDVQTLGVFLDALYVNVFGGVDQGIYELLGDLKSALHDEEQQFRALAQLDEVEKLLMSTDERNLFDRGKRTDFTRVVYTGIKICSVARCTYKPVELDATILLYCATTAFMSK